MLSQSQRREIVGRSRTLSERLATDAVTTDDLPEHVDEWTTAWRTRFDDEAWRSRVERVGVESRRLPARLVGEPAEEPLPEWIDELTALTAALAEREPHVPDGEWDPERPFVHVLVPVVEHAAESIDWPAWLGADAVHDFETALAERLERMFAHPLFVDFRYYLSQRGEDPGVGDDQYRAFVEQHLSDGLASFFHEYAFLGRLTATVIDGWREHVEQFLSRLADDRAALAETFGVDPDARVTGIESLGDPHANGRRVFGVTFDTGDRLAYKPRPVGPEATFDAVVAWSNEAGTLPSLRRLRTLQRAEYGWVEWVPPTPCDSRADADLFYRRVGVLTAMLYALDFSDGHLENLIAAGDQPVVVDLETIAQPVARLGDGDDPAAEAVRDSVLATGLIPRFLPEASLRNTAGLDPDEAVDTNAEIATFDDPNTDRMELRFRREETLEADHLPVVDGEVVPPAACRDALFEGFEAGYRFLVSNRTALLADDGPLSGVADTSLRVLLRPTKDYGEVKRRIRESASLRTGVPFGLAAEQLAGNVVDDDTTWPVYRYERRALRRYDVPRFTVAGDETVVRHDGEPVAELPDATPADRVRRRIAGLSETDLAEQLDYLRLAFDSLSLSHGGAPTPAPVPAGRDETWATRRLPRALFDRISEAAGETNDRQTWLLRDYRETRDGAGAHVAAIDDTLYGGRLGIALFGAGLAATTGADRHRAFVRETVAPVETTLAGESPYPQLDLGGTSGVGALVYGFTTLARLLDREQYLDTARRAAALATDERIAADDTYDVLRGSAGAVLGLLALHAETGDRTILDRARAAGDHLLSAGETVTPAAGKTATVWSTIQSEPLCGVSHGVGGIAYALERLGRRTGDDRYVATAREAFGFEEWAYDEAANNWPDRRDGSETEFVRGWCTGRAGIGLTRLELLRETTEDVADAVGAVRDDGHARTNEHTLGDESEPLARDVRRALAGVESRTLAHRDHLCCGNAGRIEFLLAAGRAGLGDYEDEARRLADATAQRGERAGRFTTPWTTDEWTNPTFFSGDAGIGYTLLRVANPELPCVLAFE